MRVLEFRLLALLLLPALAGCSGFSLEDKQPLTLALHSGFQADDVEIWVDQELVYSRQVTSNTFTSAGGLQMDLKEGGYLITVRVNDEVFGSQFIMLQRPLFVGVSQDAAEARIAFWVSREQFFYD